MSMIVDGGYPKPVNTTFEPKEPLATPASKISPEQMAMLEKYMAQDGADKAIAQKDNIALSPQQQQQTIDFYMENRAPISGAITAAIGAAASPQLSSHPVPVNPDAATSKVMGSVSQGLLTVLGVVTAILQPKPSEHIGTANPYSQAENALDTAIEGAEEMLSTLAPKEALVAGPVLEGVKDILGNTLSIADTASQKGDPASMASSIMLALAGVTKGITEIVNATAGKEVAERVSSVLGTVGKGLEVASEGVKPGADPFDTASKAATVAFEQAGKIAGTVKGKTSEQVAAILPHVGTITANILNMPSSNADIARNIAGVVAGTQGLVSATTQNPLSPASRALVMKSMESVILFSEMQTAQNEIMQVNREAQAKALEVQQEALEAQTKAKRDAAIIGAVAQGVGAATTGTMLVAGGVKNLKTDQKVEVASQQRQTALQPVEARKVELRKQLDSGQITENGTARPMTKAEKIAAQHEIRELKETARQADATFKAREAKVRNTAANKAAEASTATGHALGGAIQSSTHIAATDREIQATKEENLKQQMEQMQKVNDDLEKRNKELQAKFSQTMKEIIDSKINLASSIRIGG